LAGGIAAARLDRIPLRRREQLMGIVCNIGILGVVFTLNGFDPIKGMTRRQRT